MMNTTQPATVEPAALPAREAATLLGISERHLWGLASAGKLPRPIALGRSKRWLRHELESWLANESRRVNAA